MLSGTYSNCRTASNSPRIFSACLGIAERKTDRMKRAEFGRALLDAASTEAASQRAAATTADAT
jgi:hypothetical protein